MGDSLKCRECEKFSLCQRSLTCFFRKVPSAFEPNVACTVTTTTYFPFFRWSVFYHPNFLSTLSEVSKMIMILFVIRFSMFFIRKFSAMNFQFFLSLLSLRCKSFIHNRSKISWKPSRIHQCK